MSQTGNIQEKPQRWGETVYKFRTEPYSHQLHEFNTHGLDHARGLFWGMGSGKSKMLIDTVSALYQSGAIRGAVIFSNKGSYRNMAKQIDIHMPESIERYVHIWSGGNTARERSDFLDLYKSDGLRILLMNIESQVSQKGVAAAIHFVQRQITLLCVDESSTVKSHNAKRTKAMIKLAQYCPYRRIMTGTPITNSPLDVYSQTEILHPNALGFSSYYAFRANYAVLKQVDTGQRRFSITVGFRHLDDLKERIDRIASVVKKDDCLDLPAKIYATHDVEMTPAQRSAYAAMRDTAVIMLGAAEADGRIVTAQNVLTRIMRLQQIACGFVGSEDPSIPSTPLPHNRLDALSSVLDEADGKVIIFAPWRMCLAQISERLTRDFGKDAIGHYYGGISDAEREISIDGFQNGDIRFLIANQQTAGYGLTLTSSHTIVYYAQTYKLEERLQSEDRIHRIGQTNKCTYITLQAPGTVDEKIASALLKKESMAESLIVSNWRELL
jgi:SNF2 family DNA or RNA helicase